jgi:hypothetical protein
MIQAVPLQADDILLRDVLVPAGGELRNFFEDGEGELLALEPLDRVPLEH